jgi:hypothetical protein
MANLLLAPFMRWLGRLGFPKLFMLFAALFVLDTVTPDPIFMLDELLLGIGTLLFAAWKKRRSE